KDSTLKFTLYNPLAASVLFFYLRLVTIGVAFVALLTSISSGWDRKLIQRQKRITTLHKNELFL
ncbi:MAG: hypothetical protein ACRCS6_00600, partial [Turicibacter sp.]